MKTKLNVRLTGTKRDMLKVRIRHFCNTRTFSIKNLCRNFCTNKQGIRHAINELEGFYCIIADDRLIVSRLV